MWLPLLNVPGDMAWLGLHTDLQSLWLDKTSELAALDVILWEELLEVPASTYVDRYMRHGIGAFGDSEVLVTMALNLSDEVGIADFRRAIGIESNVTEEALQVGLHAQ